MDLERPFNPSIKFFHHKMYNLLFHFWCYLKCNKKVANQNCANTLITEKTFMMGDLNLDLNKKGSDSYSTKSYFEFMNPAVVAW